MKNKVLRAKIYRIIDWCLLNSYVLLYDTWEFFDGRGLEYGFVALYWRISTYSIYLVSIYTGSQLCFNAAYYGVSYIVAISGAWHRTRFNIYSCPWHFYALRFFLGTVISNAPMTGEEVTVFQEIGYTERYILITILICAVIGMVLWLWEYTVNQWNRNKKTIWHIFPAMLFYILVLSGCTAESETESGSAIYNTSVISSISWYEMVLDEQNRSSYL